MATKKGFLSAFSSIVVIPAVVIILLIDKPDYNFFNFLHRSVVPAAELVGQGITWPVRLIGKFAETIRKNKANLRENEAVIAELDRLQALIAENEILRGENNLLRKHLGMVAQIRYDAVAARIIHDNSMAENQSFVIKNPAESVSRGNVVVSNSGYFVGVVSEKVGRFAKIRSIRDSSSDIPVRISGTDVFGFVHGNGNANPELRFLSDGDFVPQNGMILITSGVNGNVPDDILVGKVKETSQDGIIVEIGADLRNQESVLVLEFLPDGGYR